MLFAICTRTRIYVITYCFYQNLGWELKIFYRKKYPCRWKLFMIPNNRFPTKFLWLNIMRPNFLLSEICINYKVKKTWSWIYLYQVFTRHYNMECFESAVPETFSYAPTTKSPLILLKITFFTIYIESRVENIK